MLTCHLTETIVRRHHDPVLREEHIATWSAEKSVPPGQQADPHDGQIRRATAVFERIRARRPLGPDNFHGANLRFDRITGADLHDSKETNRQSGVDWHHNASTLDGYLISRHIQPSDDEVAGAPGNVNREPGARSLPPRRRVTTGRSRHGFLTAMASRPRLRIRRTSRRCSCTRASGRTPMRALDRVNVYLVTP